MFKLILCNRWAEPVNYPLTDILLGIIEENAAYRQMLGFDKGAEVVNTGGKKVADIIREVTDKFIRKVAENNVVTLPTEDVPVVFASVKNRTSRYVCTSQNSPVLTALCSLKTLYIKYRTDLGQTGHGLISEGREDEITEGSEIANVWGACSLSDYFILLYSCQIRYETSFRGIGALTSS